MLASELPVYRGTYKLVDMLTGLSVNLPKVYKYTLGQKIMNVSLELFEYIQLANMTQDVQKRAVYLQGFQVKHELLKVLLRLCSEKRIISLKATAQLAELNTSIGKQISAWKKPRNI